MGLKRNIEIKIRLNRGEMDQLEKNVKKTGMSREGYIRSLINGSTPKELPPMDFYEVMKELRKISSNMNQIAVRANSCGILDKTEYRANAENLQKAIGKIMEAVFG